MNAAPGESPTQKWTWIRWVTAVAIVFAVHVVLIFIFGARKPVSPTPVKNAPSLTLAGESGGDWNALNNATLFALPANNGFAGEIWAPFPPLDFRYKADRSEDPHWLAATNPVPVAGLGVAFNRFVQTNHFAAVSLDFSMPPQIAAPVVPAQPPFAPNSTLQIQGEIAKRALLTPLKLPSWPDDDVIAPSDVQVLVDAAGRVVSATLLPPENSLEPSASRDSSSDQYAVSLARTFRFAPLPSSNGEAQPCPLSRLALGQLTFNWQTVPRTTANGH